MNDILYNCFKNINNDWHTILLSQIDQPYFYRLNHFITEEYANHYIYPDKIQIFNALSMCSFENTRVVIIGQDPYHQKNMANGLCFSTFNALKTPLSLQNIFKVIHSNFHSYKAIPNDLSFWANQGVLLLNSIFTVRENIPLSHKNKGWENFTKNIMEQISELKSHVVFMLWGNYAQSKKLFIDETKHFILSCGHPSPLAQHSRQNRFLDNTHFLQCNHYLEKHKIKPIKWY